MDFWLDADANSPFSDTDLPAGIIDCLENIIDEFDDGKFLHDNPSFYLAQQVDNTSCTPSVK
ncbi:hypothetical protein IKG06_01375 [Candidatus Saccharibacteria bacterium]|nr:hypothetical protein [Candidatus Saccharibacteria bacterium]